VRSLTARATAVQMSEKARHINAFLRRSQAASGLLEGVERDARLLEAIRRDLAAELRPHCLHASLEDGRLRLLTDGPVWATRLRFAAPDVLARLRAQGQAAAEARVRIAPATAGGGQAEGIMAAPRLSAATVAHLKAVAAAMDDARLAAALLRLAGGGAGSTQDTARGRGP
jgi:hypothetical protein